MYCERECSNGIWSAVISVIFPPCTVMRTCTVPYRLSYGLPLTVRVCVLVAGAVVDGVVVADAAPCAGGAVAAGVLVVGLDAATLRDEFGRVATGVPDRNDMS